MKQNNRLLYLRHAQGRLMVHKIVFLVIFSMRRPFRLLFYKIWSIFGTFSTLSLTSGQTEQNLYKIMNEIANTIIC